MRDSVSCATWPVPDGRATDPPHIDSMTHAAARARQSPRIPAHSPARWWHHAGPYLNLFYLLVAGLAMLSLSRLALVVWQHERVAATGLGGGIFVQGIRADLILLGYFIVVPLALAPFLAHRRTARLWTALTTWWATAALVFIGFMELASPQFILQYDVRPNRLFIEYLAYPAEVFGTLWHGYRLALCVTIGATIGLALLCHRRCSTRSTRCARNRRRRKSTAACRANRYWPK
jgi:phosphoglycerol transferase MdoB-like AlkP superfamily enzyme